MSIYVSYIYDRTWGTDYLRCSMSVRYIVTMWSLSCRGYGLGIVGLEQTFGGAPAGLADCVAAGPAVVLADGVQIWTTRMA